MSFRMAKQNKNTELTLRYLIFQQTFRIKKMVTSNLKNKTPSFQNLQRSFIVSAVGSVVEQVAAVLDALSDAKETTRLRVIGLVERLAVRLDRVEADNCRLKEENQQLHQQLHRVSS